MTNKSTKRRYVTSDKGRATARAYYLAHKEQQRAANARWVASHRDVIKEYAHNRNQRLKVEVIKAYGGQCVCCGEAELEFLAIDHINGGGSAHRRQVKREGTGNFYLWVINEGFPLGFRVLCHNCNFAIGKYQFCPHSRKPPMPPALGSWHKRL